VKQKYQTRPINPVCPTADNVKKRKFVKVWLFDYLSFYFQLHRTENDAESSDNAHLPCMSHSSQLKMVAACNCGYSKADKDDPFDHKVKINVPLQIISSFFLKFFFLIQNKCKLFDLRFHLLCVSPIQHKTLLKHFVLLKKKHYYSFNDSNWFLIYNVIYM